ncbi:uncharacterized protein STAUR_2873 [Stigmatella aurantiaca DW4/3-1]|uniref:Chitin-binding type-4 domain-containing protein n=1 Tax=Stigmatella aurantiaca (strain DW4/3-1) TaxID=378806 RepID=E3FP47_STIAD|nr:uncharacterized protein STAUR_2873 [Stigmatella aurantiaca DW4/3-1]
MVTPLPQHVCGFGSETWRGGATPWDQPIHWPASNLSPGLQTITWNITWGPHFDDTKEFRYWITKPGFVYQVGKPLAWDDFEEAAFCVLAYDDSNPNGNPDISPDKASEHRPRRTVSMPRRQPTSATPICRWRAETATAAARSPMPSPTRGTVASRPTSPSPTWRQPRSTAGN